METKRNWKLVSLPLAAKKGSGVGGGVRRVHIKLIAREFQLNTYSVEQAKGAGGANAE